MLAGLIVLPLALLSPRAFYDATVVFHAKQLAVPALGTPQWNESLAGQLAGVGLVEPDVASPVASIMLVALLLGLFVAAALKIRDAASALLWAALISGVSFAFNSGRVHFFYWRLTLLLFLLGFVMSFLPHEDAGAADVNHAEADAKPALVGAAEGR